MAAIDLLFSQCYFDQKPSMSTFTLTNNFFSSFRILFRTLNHQYDYTFDWTMLKQLNVPPSTIKIIPPNGEREKEKQQHTTEAVKLNI